MNKILSNNPIFIMDLANNHAGRLDHGLNIIKSVSIVKTQYPEYTFIIKFQYRNLDTFIHPDFQNSKEYKYIKRFKETRLSFDDYLKLKHEAEQFGFLTACTPFDSESVDVIEQHKFDIIKIASCSMTDWPLLERIALTDNPIIFSTAGASFNEIDQVYAFFKNRNKEFAIMHCIAEYPTEHKHLELNQIDIFKKRYPDIPIGFSTHEDPSTTESLLSISIAAAKGATLFERHVDISSHTYEKINGCVNKYSADRQQIKKWIDAVNITKVSCGIEKNRYESLEAEQKSLLGLRRGVFANRYIHVNEKITKDDVFFAIPCQEGQLSANDFSKHVEFTASSDIQKNCLVGKKNVNIKDKRKNILPIVHDIQEILKKGNIIVSDVFKLQLSHHYGIEKFREYGAGIIDVVNREYCKKLIVLLPGQQHPNHYHVRKEEVFQLLYGDLELDINGYGYKMKIGETFLVERYKYHAFYSKTGCVFEEISSTHYKEDSFYDDTIIMGNYNDRKTDLVVNKDFIC